MSHSGLSSQLIDLDAAPPLIPADYRAPATIHSISPAIVLDCLRAGWSDYRQARTYGLLFSAFYVVWGILLVSSLFALNVAFLVFPVIAGFLLVGPIVVVGLYDVSRRIETGEALALKPVLFSFTRHGATQLLLFGALLVFIMVVWLKAAALLYALTFGLSPIPAGDILVRASTDTRVLTFLLAGNAIGAGLAALVFCISVAGIPYLLDKDVDFITAATTSIRAVMQNKGPMVVWAIILAVMLLGSVATGFLGLLVALPVAGHTTWHLYRRMVEDQAQ